MSSFLQRLLDHPAIGPMVVHHRRIEARPPVFSPSVKALDPRLTEALSALGIDRLYEHQARAVDAAGRGANVLAVTPTASGKTLVFAVPVLQALLGQPDERALFLYPTKALARDQLGALRSLAAGLGALRPPSFEIYDGDTPSSRRRAIRADPPQVLITNPDMLHLGILSGHQGWGPFLRKLRFVALDELHVYRGLFGAHVHHVLARLRRLCAGLGASPRFLAASATVGNPHEFASTLVGEPFEIVDRSGAPSSARDVVFLNPVGVSPYTVAVRLLAETARAGLKTIAFTKARRVTELLHTWLVRQDPGLAGRVAPYRAGYLPEERRALEARLFSGELSAVISTSALELGIDVGGLDVCVLVGYPGSLISAWQRIGRVGRGRRDALVVMIAMPDSLDQYVVRHPELFFDGAFEPAVLDPDNPHVASRHLICAAAERPLDRAELGSEGSPRHGLVAGMVRDGKLRQDAGGERWYSFRRKPQRDVNLRSAAPPFTIVEHGSDRVLGSVDGVRVHSECHPGAVYLHGGRSYRIERLDAERRRVHARPARLDYYTVVLGEKETEILERLDRRGAADSPVCYPVGLGRLRVTVRIRGYQKRRLFDGEPVSTHPLDVPPHVFETVGMWIELPEGLPAVFTERELHFMGGIHATEHAMIGLLPLLAIADRGDVGGISYTGHAQIGGPAIFLYDAMAGGAGLAERAFRELRDLLERTSDLVEHCPCEAGCPACIQSPRCGNGNKPLDKEAALLVMRVLLGSERVELPEPAEVGVAATPVERTRGHGITRVGGWRQFLPEPREPEQASRAAAAGRVLVFDLETQRSAADVGGWRNARDMRVALAVVHDVARGEFRTYHEPDVHRLLLDLVMADLVVGYNIDRFDLAVLSSYTDWDLGRIRTCDMLERIRRVLGYRLSLAHLSEVNLGMGKAADGLQSLEWWRQGRTDLIERYCRRDVEVTHRLYELGQSQGYLLYRDREQRMLRVPVAW